MWNIFLLKCKTTINHIESSSNWWSNDHDNLPSDDHMTTTIVTVVFLLRNQGNKILTGWWCKYFGCYSLSQAEFQKKLAWEMMSRGMKGKSVQEENRRTWGNRKHKFILLRLTLCDKEKIKKVKSKNQPQCCKNYSKCQKQIQTYCACANGNFLDVICFMVTTNIND